MMSAPPVGSIEVRCAACQKYLGTLEGTYLRAVPCTCGVQTTVEIVGKRARQCVETPAGRIEVKGARP